MAALLGVTWSPAAESLPDLKSLVDVIEAPTWELEAALALSDGRVILHGLDRDVSLADPSYIDETWAERTCSAITRSGTPWYSLHLGFASERVHFQEHMLPRSEPLERDLLFARIVENVRRAKAYVDLPLLLENLDYCPEGAYEHVCAPEFISEVLETINSGLLLDLAHLRVTSSWIERDPFEMLDALPLDRVVEVHVSGPRPIGNSERLDDVHDTMTDHEVQLLREVLRRSDPRLVVLEYRRDPDALRQQLAQLGSIIGRRWRGRAC